MVRLKLTARVGTISIVMISCAVDASLCIIHDNIMISALSICVHMYMG